jgi:hypothetical protein
MFVLNPDPYLLPCYLISPFQTKDIHVNNLLPQSDLIDDYCRETFKNRYFYYLSDGRKAINTALKQYNLQKDDVVTILTTSGNFYISGCVTKEIEKFCNWSRVIEKGTKILFVNHEFGYPFKNVQDLKKYNLPIIEDCAHSFFSTDTGQNMGNTGDFVICSFPKIFPLQIGGLLISKKDISINEKDLLNTDTLKYIKNAASHGVSQRESIISERKEHYQYLIQKLCSDIIEERFERAEGAVPGVFMFKVKKTGADLVRLKEHMYAHGIQCSVFYGEQSFFIPVHQNLQTEDLDYFISVIHHFFKAGL